MKTVEVSKEVAEEVHRLNGRIVELEQAWFHADRACTMAITERDELYAKCRRYEEDNANMEKALRGILKMRDCDGEDLLDAQLMAAMAVNPEDYDADARAGWGLR